VIETNDSGKSNLYKALSLLARVGRGSVVELSDAPCAISFGALRYLCRVRQNSWF
jgi:hypothetical protein